LGKEEECESGRNSAKRRERKMETSDLTQIKVTGKFTEIGK
jgi:hypothetical protein